MDYPQLVVHEILFVGGQIKGLKKQFAPTLTAGGKTQPVRRAATVQRQELETETGG